MSKTYLKWTFYVINEIWQYGYDWTVMDRECLSVNLFKAKIINYKL